MCDFHRKNMSFKWISFILLLTSINSIARCSLLIALYFESRIFFSKIKCLNFMVLPSKQSTQQSQELSVTNDVIHSHIDFPTRVEQFKLNCGQLFAIPLNYAFVYFPNEKFNVVRMERTLYFLGHCNRRTHFFMLNNI